ncbi:MAG TPA: amidohydrolase [Acetobacteraceae bacterium]|nr:amidohydrolase [Acetobacteraceae bacterium]
MRYPARRTVPGPTMPDMNTDALKTRLVDLVNQHAKLAQVINDSLFSFAELGFHEIESSKFLTATLEQHGFTVQRGVAGMPSGWVARFGDGGPVIALGSDIDALPNVSQVPGLAYHKPMVEGGPGHGEGHNSGQAVNIAAALALKELMQREGLPGTLMLWPGIAEELLAGKAFQVRDGLFDGVDTVLFTHVGYNLETGWGEVTGAGGLISVEYAFHGASAHAAAAPWRGRSALDAVELMNMGWNVRREHLRPEQRSHYIITYGGEQPNVVPALAKVWYYLRETDVEGVRKNFAICNRIADGAAMMTDTEVTRRMLGASWPRHYNRILAETVQANIERTGLPEWTRDDQRFARAVQRAAGGKEVGLATEVAKITIKPHSPGTDDIGDVSWVVPTVQIRYPANMASLPGHHWSNAMAMATPIAHKGVVAGAKVVAGSVLDLLLQPDLVAGAKRYFTEVQCKDQHYEPFIGKNDKPPIDLNQVAMDKFRPLQKQFYYDPAKYTTYLEQLGVVYPTLEPPQ